MISSRIGEILNLLTSKPSIFGGVNVLHDLARETKKLSQYSSQRGKSQQIPGPKAQLWSGNLADLRESGGMHNFLPRLHERYGPVAKFWLGPSNLFISLSNPDHIAQISNLAHTPASLQKPMKWMGDVFWVGQSSDKSERVRYVRAKLAPLLIGNLLAHLCSNKKYVIPMLNSWKEKSCPIDIKEELSRVMFQTTGSSMLGAQFDQFSGELQSYLSYIVQGTQERLEEIFPLIWNFNYWRWNFYVYRLHKQIKFFIDEAKQDPDMHMRGDFLCALISQKDENGESLFKESEIRGYVVDLLFDSGLQATPSALTWVCYAMAQDPEVQRRVQQEIDHVIGSRPPAFEDLQGLKYLVQVIKESMRIYTPVSSTMRLAHTDLEVGGYLIPKGASICIPICVLHQNEILWENPKDFRPERFDDSVIKKQHRYAYLPFGFGSRGCIGAKYALTEMQWLLAMILQRFTLSLEQNQKVIPEMRNLALQPKFGLKLFAVSRK